MYDLSRFRWCVIFLLAMSSPAFAQKFEQRVFKDAQGEHKYQVFVPAGYSPARPVPAILFLHGAGERGTDGQKQVMVGLGPYIKARAATFPFLTVFPQAEDMDGRLLTCWSSQQPDGQRALKILDAVEQEYKVDLKRVALVGWSMGGYGAWNLGAAYPDKWSAVVALSGGGDPSTVAALKDVPVWAFHGRKDSLVPVSQSVAMVDALKAAGGHVTFTEFNQQGHDIAASTFGNAGLMQWLADPKNASATLTSTSPPIVAEEAPFVPALEIPDAVGLRLGNELLDAVSYGIPQMIPPSMLSGRLNDMFDGTTVQGRSFSIRFSGISYYGQLERVQIKAIGNERLNVQLGLRNITLSIGGTSVSGARHSAFAGPIAIGIGYNRPVWLSLDVTPYIDQGKLRLRLIGSSFSIPADSYYVSPPAGVSVRGIGMTQDRVVDGLVSGLYGARGRVENEVRAIVPNIVRTLEDQLVLTDPGPLVAGMWPLPVYQPRLRAIPTGVRTDAEGVSIIMGLVAAHPDLSAKQTPLVKAASAGVNFEELKGKALGVAVSPTVLTPLSQLLINSDLARINLLDLPDPKFQELASRPMLEEVIPELKSAPAETQIRTVLHFKSPFEVGAGSMGETKEQEVPLSLRLPQMAVAVATRPDEQSAWKPYAEFDLNLQESVVASLKKPAHDRRVLALDWVSGAQVEGTGRFAQGIQPADASIQGEKFAQLFEESWKSWTSGGSAASAVVADINFTKTRLRMQSLTGEEGILSASFGIPTIKVTNLSEETFVYETKGPFSTWSTPYRLEPGKSHEFLIPYPLMYRKGETAGGEVYTLFTGTHSEYRVPRTGGAPRLFTARDPESVAISP